MSSEDVAAVRRLYDGASTGDLEAVLSCMHPDVLVKEATVLPYGGEHRGHEAFQRVGAQVWELFDLQLKEITLLDAESVVVAILKTTFTSHASGRSLDMPIVELHQVQDGLIVDVDIFYKDPSLVTDLANEGTRPDQGARASGPR